MDLRRLTEELKVKGQFFRFKNGNLRLEISEVLEPTINSKK